MDRRFTRFVTAFGCLVAVIAACQLSPASEELLIVDTPTAAIGELLRRIEVLEKRIAQLEQRLDEVELTDDDEPPVVDLSGDWLLTLPAGFEHRVTLKNVGTRRLRLEPKERKSLNFSGTYVVQDDRMVIIDPADERLTGFDWKILSRNALLLTDEPDVSKTGAQYVGATLTRLID